MNWLWPWRTDEVTADEAQLFSEAMTRPAAPRACEPPRPRLTDEELAAQKRLDWQDWLRRTGAVNQRMIGGRDEE